MKKILGEGCLPSPTSFLRHFRGVCIRRATIQRAAATAIGVLRHVRRHVSLAHLAHEPARVVAFVGAHRHALVNMVLSFA